jgi:hypothetical protein
LNSFRQPAAARLNPVLRQSIGTLVRTMNCYYSNLIEGHNTHPVDIDRALAGNYHQEPEKRTLQLEARARIEVQKMIDEGEMPQPNGQETRLCPLLQQHYLQLLHDGDPCFSRKFPSDFFQ